jgi:hypothetical protein
MTPENTAFLLWLTAEGYKDVRLIDDGFYIGIRRFLYTHAIIIGEVNNLDCYLDRWCYDSYNAAKQALDAWDGIGEPIGWHRHPASGRRICRVAGTYDENGRIVPVGQMYRNA